MIRVVPPVWFLLHAAAMVGAHFVLPGPTLVAAPWRYAGVALILAGVAVTAVAASGFFRHGTTVRPFEESTVLVTDGLHRFSRNPMYAGMAVALAGVAVVLGTSTPWFFVPVFVVLLTRLVVEPEEAVLERRFGDAYADYKRRVRRWI